MRGGGGLEGNGGNKRKAAESAAKLIPIILSVHIELSLDILDSKTAWTGWYRPSLTNPSSHGSHEVVLEYRLRHFGGIQFFISRQIPNGVVEH